ncbi:NotI family restriction endonuclease [Alicyclobacillus macrosporangiidus]|uniref:NotI family restriction endonuclease n=1 Tax=Alicyclobacillus macrosporangiidus TaxID=392015 RepID=UPI0009DFA9CB|nr:NotI family restriction endonuclease [Alicyclobacillus macrosporangiidus]
MLKPTDYIVEVLGCPAEEMHEPVNADYQCPYIDDRCIKRGHNTGDPFPVCTLWKHRGVGKNRVPDRPVIVCPKRFFAANLIDDILEHCWTGTYTREHIAAVREIKMGHAGNVDMVICDTSKFPAIEDFISVELQAIDITGSVSDVYTAHLNRTILNSTPKYNFNTANVFKRYLTQLIKKGYFHHTWGKKIVAVVQDFLLEDIRKRVRFAATDPKDENTSIVFMSYTLDPNHKNEDGFLELRLKDIVGTEHSALMNAVVYERPPDRDKFISAIIRQLRR